LLAPFAMCPPLACSDYYGASAPSRAFGRRRAYPTVQLDAGRRERHETVPVFDSESIDQLGTQLCPGSIATTTPQTFIVAFSPTRQAGYEVGRSNTAKERSCAASRPISARFEPAPRLRSFNHWFLSYTV